jgi:hypothetical protein
MCYAYVGYMLPSDLVIVYSLELDAHPLHLHETLYNLVVA